MSDSGKPVKLTLRLDSNLIEGAKGYAKLHGTSVSRLVADYFRRLAGNPEHPWAEGEAIRRWRARRPHDIPNDEEIWEDRMRKHGPIS